MLAVIIQEGVMGGAATPEIHRSNLVVDGARRQFALVDQYFFRVGKFQFGAAQAVLDLLARG